MKVDRPADEVVEGATEVVGAWKMESWVNFFYIYEWTGLLFFIFPVLAIVVLCFREGEKSEIISDFDYEKYFLLLKLSIIHWNHLNTHVMHSTGIIFKVLSLPSEGVAFIQLQNLPMAILMVKLVLL